MLQIFPELITYGELNNISRSISDLGTQQKATSKSKIMTMSGAAEYLDITFTELKSLIEEKNLDIPYLKVDSQYIFHEEAIAEWLKQADQKEYEIRY